MTVWRGSVWTALCTPSVPPSTPPCEEAPPLLLIHSSPRPPLVPPYGAPCSPSTPPPYGAPRRRAGPGRQPLGAADKCHALVTTPNSSPSKSCPSSDCSPVYIRRARRPDSEVLVSEDSRDTSPADPGNNSLIFDKKTKRRFLDLGVTLRRSYVRVRKDKSNRLSMGSREPSESPSRSSGSFVPFSWFTDSTRGSVSSGATPPCSPKLVSQDCSPRKSNSQVTPSDIIFRSDCTIMLLLPLSTLCFYHYQRPRVFLLALAYSLVFISCLSLRFLPHLPMSQK
ncbi:unnamed protein product [Oncorhynchus mykiss]|uniref:Uncharacterized protein n=1 Tax=Oncorhynchus mykiss TaxID=8022 RepID=A0A060Z030_ONCMY|nr:unnamed protein product [Oncorhynchus mykiss]